MTRSLSPLAILLAGLTIVGIACAVAAGVNIYAQSAHSADSSGRGAAWEGVGAFGPWTPPDEPPPWSSEYVPDETASGPPEAIYPAQPATGDSIGTLSIPALKKTIPIIEGTEDEELERGAGHFAQSVLPGVSDNCVLSGHRDTVFGGLGKLNIGDKFIVRTVAGTFTYQISKIRIVDKDDKTVIVPTDHAVLTVTTCYPFRYIGSAPDRYILIADLLTQRLVDAEPAIVENAPVGGVVAK